MSLKRIAAVTLNDCSSFTLLCSDIDMPSEDSSALVIAPLTAEGTPAAVCSFETWQAPLEHCRVNPNAGRLIHLYDMDAVRFGQRAHEVRLFSPCRLPMRCEVSPTDWARQAQQLILE